MPTLPASTGELVLAWSQGSSVPVPEATRDRSAVRGLTRANPTPARMEGGVGNKTMPHMVIYGVYVVQGTWGLSVSIVSSCGSTHLSNSSFVLRMYFFFVVSLSTFKLNGFKFPDSELSTPTKCHVICTTVLSTFHFAIFLMLESCNFEVATHLLG